MTQKMAMTTGQSREIKLVANQASWTTSSKSGDIKKMAMDDLEKLTSETLYRV